MNDRVLPQAIDSEQSLLGGIFVGYEKYINQLILYLPAEAFYKESHQIIYQTMLDLYNEDIAIDLKTVASRLKKNDMLDKVGSIDYLMSLLTCSATSAAWEYHFKEILDSYRKRKTIEVCSNVCESLYQITTSNDEALEILDNHISNNYTTSRKTNLTKISDDTHQVFKDIERVSNSDSFITGLDTGYIDLNKYTAGFQNGDLIILAARPSMGKSALALNIAYNVAKKKKTSAIFSLEMSKSQIIQRLISFDSGIESKKIKIGQLKDGEWSQITHTIGILDELPIYQDDSLDINITEMRSKLKCLSRTTKIDLVIIDYLQLMSGSKAESRQIEVSEYSRSLKGLAKDFNVPVLCLSQLNRKLEERANKRPIMSDLRESGSIEQDADVILFIYRDEVYNATTPDTKNVAEIQVAKQRNGDTGRFKMTFMKAYTLFRDYANAESDKPDCWYDEND